MNKISNLGAMLMMAMLVLFSIELQAQMPPNQDVGVRNVEFQNSPMVFPGGTSLVGFEFYANDGVTLYDKYKVGCTVCLGALAFDFVNQNDIISEMSGDGLWMWEDWKLNGTCIIGTIRADLPAGSSGKVYFPVVATEFNEENTPYYSANLVNINLQPHPGDPSYDLNDHIYGYTYTVLDDCVENVFVEHTLPSLTVKANNQIKAKVVVDEQDPVAFLAGREVLLIPGFEVIDGTDFLADIKPCQP